MYTYNLAVEPIKSELKSIGVDIKEIADLKYVSKEEYLKALPVLLEWLPKVEEESLKEDIVRTLSMPWAKPEASKILIYEFKKRPSGALSWAIGNGISITATNSDLEDLIRIVEDKSYGIGRQMIVSALGNFKTHLSERALIKLLEDEEVVGHSVTALRKLRSSQALSRIKEFTKHPNTWIRNEAKKAVLSIEKSEV